jgi:hypothetical protein
MDQNPETPNTTSQPPSEWTPEPEPAPVEEAHDQTEQAVTAAEQVVDVQSVPVEEPAPVSVNSPSESTPPLQPEIVDNSYQATTAKKNNNGWVIALIVLLVVCCCCVILLVPLWILGGFLVSILQNVYYTVISVLNSVFGGMIQIIP